VFDLQHHPEWPQLVALKDRFLKAGFKIYLVGGCVRDLYLQRKPKDFDFATNAKPEQIQTLFEKTNDIGKAFGTIQVVLDKKMYEVTTFRKDLEYVDGRRPVGVHFSDEIEDAKRRDFTMNALFYDLQTGKVIDHVGGIKDIEAKIIRFIGEPKDRIEDDKLRLLRALRFVSALGFDLDPATAAAVKQYVDEIHQVSRERIHEEMTKLIAGDFFHRVIPYLRDTEILQKLFEDKLDLTHLKDFLDLSRKDFAKLQVAFSLDNAQLFSILFFGFLLKADQFDWRKWRWSKELYSSVLVFRLLVKRCSAPLTKGDILQAMNSLEGNLLYLVKDHVKMNPQNLNIINEVFNTSLPYEKPLPEPLLSGEDLMELGFKPGKAMGESLEKMYQIQLENQIQDKNRLIAILRQSMNKS
jgi:tRNA nucleotidyltransferase/poly(A) polymerase